MAQWRPMHALPVFTGGLAPGRMGRVLALGILVLAACAALAVAAPVPQSARQDQGPLPPERCVRLSRGARIAEMNGNQPLALKRLMDAVEACPEEVTMVLALWDHYRRHPPSPEELERLRQMLTGLLEDPSRTLPPGTLAFLADNPNATREDLELILVAARKRLAAHPDDRRVLRAVAALQERLGLVEGALETLNILVAREPLPEYRWTAIGLNRRLERWADVARLMAPEAKADDASVYLRMAYAEALGRAGRVDDLVKQLDGIQAVIEAGEDGDMDTLALQTLLAQLAWDQRDAGRDDLAEQLFRRTLTLAPDHAGARKALVHLYGVPEAQLAAASGKKPAAARVSEEEEPIEVLNEGANLLAAGDAQGALETLTRATALLPEEEAPWYNLGLACFQLERWEEAESAFTSALGINPGRPDTYLQRGLARFHREAYEGARQDLEQALSLGMQRPEIHYYLALCHEKLGNAEAAARQRALYEASGSP